MTLLKLLNKCKCQGDHIIHDLKCVHICIFNTYSINICEECTLGGKFSNYSLSQVVDYHNTVVDKNDIGVDCCGKVLSELTNKYGLHHEIMGLWLRKRIHKVSCEAGLLYQLGWLGTAPS